MNNYSKYLLPAIVCILICFVLINFSSCDEGPIDPIIDYGRRDYVWEEDTLDVPLHSYISYRDIVGNSSNDIWLGSLQPGCGISMVKNGNGLNFLLEPHLHYGYLKIILFG